ncbi:MAG: queuosine salvage family protein [Candidatus Auribacterota bacterium]|nr:queuosine salvage family protein [Candidatus Auribacterota bacterium]
MISYTGKKDILDSLTPLGDDLRIVRINREVISELCAGIDRNKLPAASWDFPFIYPYLNDIGVDYFMLMNSLNFCYWGTPKWTVFYKERAYDGAWGMFAALKRAIDEEVPIYEGEFLARCEGKDFRRIFRGEGDIPLLEQRVEICREVGRVLVERFGGRFHHLVNEADGSAVRLVQLLVNNFPSFDDSAQWEDSRLLFYKRAQLAPAMLFERWEGRGAGEFRDIDEMTASADYKIPQVLRRLGILEYSDMLAKFVDEKRQLPLHSREELEIRTATIMACELIRDGLENKIPEITSQTVDRMLWYIGQDKPPDVKPYHLTLTTAY